MNLPMLRKVIPLVILLGLALTACAGAPAAPPAAAAGGSGDAVVQEQAPQPGGQVEEAEAVAPEPADQDSEPANVGKDRWTGIQPVVDEQGAVSVEVVPLNLNNPGDVLEFEVRMNTHSVDLSMNLAELATLSTDTGTVVSATGWDGAAGGHHVSGVLSFPASIEGRSILEGTKKLSLILEELDAAARLFEWEK